MYQHLKQTGMILYHSTKKENIESILENGLEPSLSNKISHDERLNVYAVYGFNNIQDAIDFMVYDNNESEYAVFSFQSEYVVIDTEYDENNAYAVITDENIKCTLVNI